MIRIMLFAAGAALALAGPAVAQDANDAAVEAAMNNNNVMTVRNVTRPEMTPGVQIFDTAGQLVGTVSHLSGNDVIVADGSRAYSVLITEFYAYNQHGKDYVTTRRPKATWQAQASTAGAKPLAVAN